MDIQSGYGDIYPVTQGQRVFGIFFGLFGILVLGNVAPGIVFGQLVNTFQKTQSDSKNKNNVTSQNDSYAEYRNLMQPQRL